jgi:NAD(P)-dependent dehydrogenase (short-subunit alcohol dehydrogenase family)/uncharacterized membrane protein
VLALAGAAVAAYLTLFQVGVIHRAWDPVFGSASSAAVVDSPLSRVLPVPDAALGAAAYVVEALLVLAGPRDRWRAMPWLVLAFGVAAAGLLVAGLVLVLTQAFVVRAWCSLCLLSAAISLVMAASAWPEVRAAAEVAFGDGASRRQSDGRHAGESQPAVSRESAGFRPSTRKEVADSSSPLHVMTDSTYQGMNQAGASEGAAHQAPSATSRPRDLMAEGPAGGHSDRVVVVTGASAGVGRATAIAFAKQGCDVAVLARGRDGLEGARRDVESAGGRALPIQVDVSDADAVERAAAQVEETLGPIDVWVNVAMVSVFSPAREMRADEYKRVTDVTYLGYVYGTLAALKRMLPRDRGRIIQVGSALAYRGIPLQSAYCGAKHAIQGFTESVRCELIHDGSHVKISMAQLPAVNTPQFDWVKSRLPHRAQPVPPIYQPEVIANAIVWLSEHYRRELNIGGSTDLAIYANRVVPGWLDYYLGWTGYDSQQTGQPRDPDAPDNLYEPVDAAGRGDHGAHGRFDDRASYQSRQLWAAEHRGVLLGGIAAAAFGTVALARTMLSR